MNPLPLRRYAAALLLLPGLALAAPALKPMSLSYDVSWGATPLGAAASRAAADRTADRACMACRGCRAGVWGRP